MLTRTFFARAPLAPGRFAPLPVGAVSAQGATRDRLLALRGGLLSRCASVFPEAGEQSAWFGGPLGGGMRRFIPTAATAIRRWPASPIRSPSR